MPNENKTRLIELKDEVDHTRYRWNQAKGTNDAEKIGRAWIAYRDALSTYSQTMRRYNGRVKV